MDVSAIEARVCKEAKVVKPTAVFLIATESGVLVTLIVVVPMPLLASKSIVVGVAGDERKTFSAVVTDSGRQARAAGSLYICLPDQADPGQDSCAVYTALYSSTVAMLSK